MRPNKSRCQWADGNPLMSRYHDEEWGIPVYDDRKLFEFLILEGAQAGLAWQTVLNKREHYRMAFSSFDPHQVARYNDQKVKVLLANPGIIRNRLKIRAAITNAQQFLEVQKEFGSFSKYLWQFVGGKPLQHKIISYKQIPVTSKESEMLSKDLKKRGFKFVGSTICYAFMQAVGMVNDHERSCFRCKEIKQLATIVK